MGGRRFDTGDRVLVISGPFEGYEGLVESVDAESGCVRVGISMFGRVAPVSVATEDLGRLDDRNERDSSHRPS